jgi:uncharacterized peroxidase-related enzyme
VPRIQPLEPENAPEQTRQLMEQGEQATGQMLNFFKQMAVSPASFKAYMDFDGDLQEGALDQLTHESIYMATSDYNGCTYCLSAHSAVAEQAGMSEDEIERAQRFESEDEQRAAALRFAREVVDTRGHPSEESLEKARNAGYTDEQIMEMIATVALATFSNYMNETIDPELDLPIREPTGGR